MKRMHVHVSVDDLRHSIDFYSVLFAAQPTVVKTDYAKWMLDDPRMNFAISARGRQTGLSFGASSNRVPRKRPPPNNRKIQADRRAPMTLPTSHRVNVSQLLICLPFGSAAPRAKGADHVVTTA